MTASAGERIRLTGERAGSRWFLVFLVPVGVILLPIVRIAVIVWQLTELLLLIAVWVTWIPRGRHALVVYSDSPVWQKYFESRVLPAVGSRAVALNWSDRRAWRFSLATLVFRMFAGDREYNPIAIVFRPFARPRRFRFYQPFIAFKHGRPQEVDALCAELLTTLDDLSRAG